MLTVEGVTQDSLFSSFRGGSDATGTNLSGERLKGVAGPLMATFPVLPHRHSLAITPY
ncbi:hypothetical protein [Kamptonema formosum]|uniref:hypothetical protein n=1 Tax=Kamptonema formosum TaxID=331992 RepID=UPI000347CA04|nr:hypothetical protein [Oscillatoria sp. PCC 10802]